MDQLKQLFMEEKFHPLDPETPPISELLALPLSKNLQNKKENAKVCLVSLYYYNFNIHGYRYKRKIIKRKGTKRKDIKKALQNFESDTSWRSSCFHIISGYKHQQSYSDFHCQYHTMLYQ